MIESAETIALRLACESLSCAVMSAHRARTNAAPLPKKLRNRIERAHKALVNLTMAVAGELSKAVTRTK